MDAIDEMDDHRMICLSCACDAVRRGPVKRMESNIFGYSDKQCVKRETTYTQDKYKHPHPVGSKNFEMASSEWHRKFCNICLMAFEMIATNVSSKIMNT